MMLFIKTLKKEAVITAFLTSFLLLTQGCTTSSRDLRNGMTLKELTQKKGSVREGGINGQVPLWADNILEGFSRNQANELENIFPQFPNPTIYIYIDPHVTSDGLPLPGVTTKTKMLKRDAYALPHEVVGMGM